MSQRRIASVSSSSGQQQHPLERSSRSTTGNSTSTSSRMTTSAPISLEASLTLDPGSEDDDKSVNNNINNNNSSMTPLSLDDRYEAERQSVRLKHWKESPFAVGLVDATWDDEQQDRDLCCCINTRYCQQDIDPSGCLCCSGFVCGRLLGAGRVGNMAVLKQTHEWVEHVAVDEETGQETVQRRYQRPTLHCVVGPYWPMLLCVTYPLIVGVSGWTLVAAILPGRHHFLVVLAWMTCTLGLIYALAKTAFSDPGILYRHHEPPPQNENQWRWSDQAQTYRPRGAFYDVDCAVVVEEFDHTCPWTGTAIGKRNMPYFQAFVGLVFLCLILDILLLTRAI